MGTCGLATETYSVVLLCGFGVCGPCRCFSSCDTRCSVSRRCWRTVAICFATVAGSAASVDLFLVRKSFRRSKRSFSNRPLDSKAWYPECDPWGSTYHAETLAFTQTRVRSDATG